MKPALFLLALACLACLSCALENGGKHWALLVAGSNGFYNYRHQADVCHAYQILHAHGIPDERIVVMMYDDIAYHKENPTPGVIINYPEGNDVYAGVPKDYTGKDVTPENFLSVLKGDAAAMNGTGSGKVIASGPNDHVFVNFVDHGAKGILGFPNSRLHAKDLNDALMEMSSKNQFSQMLLYIEACESGSMFEGLLPDNINIYATTAANSSESSYACYFDEERMTFLGDVYSVHWMQDSDMRNLNLESLYKQFKLVRRRTKGSHVKEFGDLDISREDLAAFQGEAEGVGPVHLPEAELHAIPSEQVPLAILYRKFMASRDHEESEQLRIQIEELRQTQTDIERSMRSIVNRASGGPDNVEALLSGSHGLTQHECYRAAVDAYSRYCWDISQFEYAMRHLYALSNLCETGHETDTVTDAVKDVCMLKLY